MKDIYLKATTKAELINALPEKMIYIDNQNQKQIIVAAADYVWDWDVPVWQNPPTYNPQTGDVISEGERESGFFSNLRLMNKQQFTTIETALGAFIVNPPSTPSRVWA